VIESRVDEVREEVDLFELIHESLTAFQVRAQEKDLQVVVNVDPALPQLRGHPVRLGQAINNLISNAVKYTPSGGSIVVSATLEEDEIVVRVADTGPGIPPDKQAGLFGKFYRVGGQETLKEEGHGLGLAIVKSIVEAHGGRVGVESAVGQGTAFTSALPLTSGLACACLILERRDA
jgi:signal transduction histidine kinase